MAERSNLGELAGRRGLRAARLEAVLRVIRTEYSDPHIAPDRVATRFGISTRYLHHLLQETGTSFAERVQDLRLEKAFSLLSGETGASRNVSDAAYGAGFSDLSLFNRLFRLRKRPNADGCAGARAIAGPARRFVAPGAASDCARRQAGREISSYDPRFVAFDGFQFRGQQSW